MTARPVATIALLWDHSHLWGLLLHRALSFFGLPFVLVRGRDVPRLLDGAYVADYHGMLILCP